MTNENIRKYLRQALNEVISTEEKRVTEILNDSDTKIAEGIEKMKPLMELLLALKQEVGEVPGLDISLAKHGHMATVVANTSVTYDSYSISTNYDNSKFKIEIFSTFSVDDSIHEETIVFDTADEAMEKIINLVGEHIGGERAQSERTNA